MKNIGCLLFIFLIIWIISAIHSSPPTPEEQSIAAQKAQQAEESKVAEAKQAEEKKKAAEIQGLADAKTATDFLNRYRDAAITGNNPFACYYNKELNRVGCGIIYIFPASEWTPGTVNKILEAQRKLVVRLKPSMSEDFDIQGYTSDRVLIGYVSFNHWIYQNGNYSGKAISVEQVIDLTQY